MIPDPQPARFARPYPYHYRRALVVAAMQHDLRQIDILTDALALQGYCRERRDYVIQPWHIAAARGLSA